MYIMEIIILATHSAHSSPPSTSQSGGPVSMHHSGPCHPYPALQLLTVGGGPHHSTDTQQHGEFSPQARAPQPCPVHSSAAVQIIRSNSVTSHIDNREELVISTETSETAQLACSPFPSSSVCTHDHCNHVQVHIPQRVLHSDHPSW